MSFSSESSHITSSPSMQPIPSPGELTSDDPLSRGAFFNEPELSGEYTPCDMKAQEEKRSAQTPPDSQTSGNNSDATGNSTISDAQGSSSVDNGQRPELEAPTKLSSAQKTLEAIQFLANNCHKGPPILTLGRTASSGSDDTQLDVLEPQAGPNWFRTMKATHGKGEQPEYHTIDPRLTDGRHPASHHRDRTVSYEYEHPHPHSRRQQGHSYKRRSRSSEYVYYPYPYHMMPPHPHSALPAEYFQDPQLYCDQMDEWQGVAQVIRTVYREPGELLPGHEPSQVPLGQRRARYSSYEAHPVNHHMAPDGHGGMVNAQPTTPSALPATPPSFEPEDLQHSGEELIIHPHPHLPYDPARHPYIYHQHPQYYVLGGLAAESHAAAIETDTDAEIAQSTMATKKGGTKRKASDQGDELKSVKRKAKGKAKDGSGDDLLPEKRTKLSPKRKQQVHRACNHCKHAHLACDESRPCRRCTHLGKEDCVDVEHKPRGRPKNSKTKKGKTVAARAAEAAY